MSRHHRVMNLESCPRLSFALELFASYCLLLSVSRFCIDYHVVICRVVLWEFHVVFDRYSYAFVMINIWSLILVILYSGLVVQKVLSSYVYCLVVFLASLGRRLLSFFIFFVEDCLCNMYYPISMCY
ncbi:hypothetical protein Hanom_Chr01g00054031 [Helianthus anomalus]